MTNKFKRFMSLALVLVMIFGMLPVSAFAVPAETADLILEAETDAVLAGGANVPGGTAFAGVGGIKDDTNTATFTVPSDNAGTATISIYYGTWNDRQFTVSVNGGEAVVADAPGTGDWWALCQTPVVVEVELVNGDNTVVIGGVGDAPNLDGIAVDLPEEDNIVLNFDFSDVSEDGTVVNGIVKTADGVVSVEAAATGVTFADGVALYAASEDDAGTGITYTPAEGEDPMANLTAGATIAMWVKNSETEFSHPLFSYGALQSADKAGAGTMGASVQVGVRTNNNSVVLYRNASGSTGGHKINTACNMAADQWHLVVLVEDANGANQFYLDGVQIGTHNGSGKTLKGFATDTEVPDNYYIGFLPYESDDTHFAGQIDNVTVYDKAMTADEVKAIYDERMEAEGLNQAAADAVAGQIAALAVESLEDEDAVVAARAAYEALSDVQKALVSEDTVAALEAAEKAVYDLKANAETLKIEAETGVISGGAGISNNASASGGQHVGDLGNGGGVGAVTLSVPTAEDCTATVNLYYISGGQRDFSVTVNGGDAQIVTAPSAGSWTVPSETPVSVTVALVAGDNTIVIAGNGGYAPNLDYIEIVKQAEVIEPEAGTAENPIWLDVPEATITLAAGQTKYYTARVGGMVMTVNGDVTVEHNGETFTAVDGVVTLTPVQTSMWEPPVFKITNGSEAEVSAAVSFAYPEGSMDNPAALVLGENTAAVTENGWFYNWTAEADGTLTISVDTSKTSNWTYAINNNTTFAYGDTHAVNDETVVSSERVAVKAGDEIQVILGTVDWTAGTVVINASFEAAAVEPPVEDIIAEEIVAVNSAVEITVGETKALEYTPNPEGANVADISWYCQDTAIAEVDGTGNVYGVAAGSTVIEATLNGRNTVTYTVTVAEAPARVVLDSAWEVEKQNENLTINADGSVTIITEQGTIGDANGINNALYMELPNSTDYYFTVKVNGSFTQNFHGAYLMIASGKNLENAVGVVRRYHGYLGGNYGTNMLMGVMQVGNPAEYYEAAADIGDEFYLKLQKQNGRITGFYAAEYSDNADDWNQIIDGNYEFVDKGNALVSPETIYLALGACAGGTNNATPITFSDLRVNGESVSFVTDPGALKQIAMTGPEQIDVNAEGTLTVTASDYEGNEVTLDSLSFTSSDETVAAVSDAGVVKGLTDGFVTITATAVKNGVTKTAELNVQIGQIKADGSWTVTSPDGNTSITVELITGGTLQYRTVQGEYNNIQNSSMGLVTNLGDFSKNLVLKSASEVTEINETYNMLSGKDNEYVNHCNEQTLTFVRKDNADVEFDVVIRAYDDGTAYRYGIRGEDGAELSISDETSGLTIPAEATIYWMNYSSPSWNYESNYNTATTESLAAGSTPSMPFMYGKDGVWTLFTEANLHGTYTGSMLTVTETGIMDVAFSKKQGSTAVKTTVPFESPWRVAITGDLEAIVENTLVENLADPADEETYKFSEWVYPGLSSWSWVANWGGGISDQSKAETHLKWIEFGAEIGWDFYILDEGWAAQGRGNVQPNENGMRDWWPEVKAAAEEADVKLWAWVHVSDIRDNAKREALFEYWASEGIVGIKPDFFDGEDQATIQLYDELYEDAAKYGLMVLVHGANKPTGEVRTWPNVYGREAIKGQESGGITAEQYTLIPYIRAAIGPAEVTEELRSKDTNKTTQGFQIALTALIEDGIHSMGSEPKVYRENPEGMAYYTNYPSGWIDTEFVSGEIGQYLNIARLANNGTGEWYLSGISVAARTQEVSLSFLDSSMVYTALLYRENGRSDLVEEVIPAVTSESELEISNLYGGGYAVRLVPVDGIETYTKITAPAEISVEERLSVVPEIVCEPADAEYTNLVWTSADESIATVEDGVITGVAEGTTTITVAAAFTPTVKAEIKVTVTPSSYNFMKIEAESGTNNTGEIRTVNADTHSGGAYVGGWDNGGSATYTFTSGGDDEVVMEIYGCSAAQRALVVTINGVTKQVDTANTGSWDSTNDNLLCTVTIPVIAGENTLVIGGPAAANTPNVDYFIIPVPKVVEGGILSAEGADAIPGAEVKVPLTLANVEAMLASEGTDGTIGGIQFTVNGGETVSVKGFEPAEVFAGYDWSVQDNMVLGFDMAMAENSSAAVTGDTVIGSLVLETSADFTGAVVMLEDVSVCDGVGVNYNVAAESFELTVCLAAGFEDVDLNEWYHPAVDFVLGEKFMSGDLIGTFRPNDALTRAELVQILYNINDRPAIDTDKTFSDVAEADWYYPAVMWAAENGYVLGDDVGTFRPEDLITREEMVTIMWRYMGKAEPTDTELTFVDAASVSNWAVTPIAWAVENGVVKGHDGNRFAPEGNTLRCEIAQVMKNIFDR